MYHFIISLIFATTCLVCHLPESMFYYPAFFYIGREIAQAEYRYIEFHGNIRSKCPWYCGFIPSAWTWKGLFDWMLAVFAGIVIHIIKYLNIYPY